MLALPTSNLYTSAMTANTMLDKELVPYEALPPEATLDKYHPNNHDFFRQCESIKRMMVAQAREMKATHVQVAKLLVKGAPHKDIAEQINVVPATVSQIKAREDVQKLIALVHHMNALYEGPTMEHRKRMLYEIALDMQRAEPKTSISAIQEMNRMDGVGKDNKDTTITLNINNELFPRTALDRG